MAIQAQRDKKRADDLIAKATKKQAQIENAARAQEAAKQKESISIAVDVASSTIAAAGAPAAASAVQAPRKRVVKFKFFGGFCLA